MNLVVREARKIGDRSARPIFDDAEPWSFGNPKNAICPF